METDSPSITELADTLGARLRAPYRRLQRRLYGSLELRFPDIRRAHSVVFRHIGPDGSRLTDLAAQAEMTKQSMAYLIGHLEAHGYLHQTNHPEDGRATLVKLTAKGRRFVETAAAASRELEAEVAAELGKARVAQLRELLVALDQALAKSAEDAAG
ncbi:MAG TPA: MarR family winged helix-turn-helix transcriptional regulator [Opitutaceae bacterium]|nr:MarR family winged helix-turn-helix transcriptional regulator [Opitutaceae bacterium]